MSELSEEYRTGSPANPVDCLVRDTISFLTETSKDGSTSDDELMDILDHLFTVFCITELWWECMETQDKFLIAEALGPHVTLLEDLGMNHITRKFESAHDEYACQIMSRDDTSMPSRQEGQDSMKREHRAEKSRRRIRTPRETYEEAIMDISRRLDRLDLEAKTSPEEIEKAHRTFNYAVMTATGRYGIDRQGGEEENSDLRLRPGDIRHNVTRIERKRLMATLKTRLEHNNLMEMTRCNTKTQRLVSFVVEKVQSKKVRLEYQKKQLMADGNRGGGDRPRRVPRQALRKNQSRSRSRSRSLSSGRNSSKSTEQRKKKNKKKKRAKRRVADHSIALDLSSNPDADEMKS